MYAAASASTACANLGLRVAPSGASVLDFGAMDPVLGKSAGMTFDFRYAGKASATLSTPARGTMTARDANYSALRVTANLALPGAGKIAMFKDKPVSELTEMATAIAGSVGKKGAPPATPGASAPGIEASPVFSNNRYECEVQNLKLYGGAQTAEWLFTRATP